MDLRWEPNYRVIRLKSPWSVMVEDQISCKAKCCNVGDLKPKHPAEDCELKPNSISRAARFINHPNNLPNVVLSLSHDLTLDVQRYQRGRMDTNIILGSPSRPLQDWNCDPHTKNARDAKQKKSKITKKC